MTGAGGLEILAWIARGVGAWYLITGAAVLGAWWRHQKEPAEGLARIRNWTVLAIGVLTLDAGLLLLMLSGLAAHVFLACCAVQGAYFAWARKALPPKDEAGRRARAASFNSFLVFVGATLFVLGCRMLGLLW